MSKRPALLVALGIVLVATLATACGLTIYFVDLPQHLSQMETLVLGQPRFVPGSQAALRVVVRDVSDQQPISGADIRVSMRPADGGKPIALFEGTTDEQGTAAVSFTVPSGVDASQDLIVDTSSTLGDDHLEQTVTVERDFRVLLTSDKPLYQPGQVIHVRALALSDFDLVPAADQSVEFTIADGKGNKVFRQTVETSSFGVAAADFQLADEVNTGPYKITAVMGNTSSEKTVTVERYVLPKFKVALSTDRTFYLPGEHVTGTLSADYFFGKKVSEGQVRLEIFTFDVERQDWVSLGGETDENGSFSFEFDLPPYVVGTELEGGAGRVYLLAKVTDQAQHTEQTTLSLPVAQSSLVIEAMPESGQLKPGLENILYILTSYPDGAPAKTELRVTAEGQTHTLRTGDYGLAEFRFTPSGAYLETTITAEDATGAFGEQLFTFEGTWEQETVLLRPDRAVYRVGETMRLDVLTSSPSGDVYLDIVRQGQTMSTRAVTIQDGRGVVHVDLAPDLFGTLELHAYKILSWGGIVRDTRLVVVDAPTGLSLTITPDQETYRPGDTARVGFEVQGRDRAGVQSALGLAVVDESVFALAEQDPGFAKLYFLLEAELLQPKFDIHGFSLPDLIGERPVTPEMRTAVEGAAQASLAKVAAASPAFGLSASSHEQRMQLAHERQAAYFRAVGKVAYGTAILLPLGIMGLCVFELGRRRLFGRSVAPALVLILGLALAILLIPVPDWVGRSPLDRLGYILETLFSGGEAALLLCPAVGFVGFIALAIYAIVRRDWTLGWMQLLFVVFLAVAVLFVIAAASGNLDLTEATGIPLLLAYLLVPAAFLLRAMAFAADRKIALAGASFLATAFVSVAWAAPLGLLSMGAMAPAMMDGGGGEIMLEMAAPAVGNVQGEMMRAALPTEAPVAAEEKPAGTAQEPPRLRQYFPETLFWQPEAITDADGRLSLDIPMADSITTWRLTALASAQDGRLGSTTAALRVFQDFFVDLDLPVALTQNDEISVPVAVFNYLPEPQTIRLDLERQAWFELLDDASKEMTIASNDIDVVYFRVRAKDFGRQALQVTAWGSKMSDAIRREVTVYPDGKPMTFTISDRLTEEGVSQKVEIPAQAIQGTQKLAVKIYPGIVSQIVEGLDSILRMPFGCFEQTSSTTYPNVLVLDYLKSTNQASPETQFKAEDYINLGYQRLTTFEVSGGGFSLFGDAPADRMLTAYGLQEFSDMSRVHSVDEAILERAARWLMDQQAADGSWEPDQGLVHENTWASLADDRLPVTAYVAWSLIESGFADEASTQSGLDYVREHSSQAEDPYVVALVANALVAADRASGEENSFTAGGLDKLASLARYDGQAAFWASSVATFMGSEGQTGSIETTALAAYALLRANSHAELANAALTYLVRQKDSFGTWYSTQATVLSLKALLESVRAGAEHADATVTVSLNGEREKALRVSPENFDVVQVIAYDDVQTGTANLVEIKAEGQGQLMYQISGSYYLPWKEVAAVEGEEPEAIGIRVSYDRTELSVDDTIRVDVQVALNLEGSAEWVLVDLGIPPGFSVLNEDLSALVDRYQDVPEDYAFPKVERYELTGRQIIVYIANLSSGKPLDMSYRLQAKFPLVAQTPASTAYDYYNPDTKGEAEPIAVVVTP